MDKKTELKLLQNRRVISLERFYYKLLFLIVSFYPSWTKKNCREKVNQKQVVNNTQAAPSVIIQKIIFMATFSYFHE